MMRHHLEYREVPSCDSDVVYVRETNRGLAYCERVGWGVCIAAYDPRLEVHDGCSHEEHIITPARQNRVALDSSMTMPLKEAQKSFAHFLKSVFPRYARLPDESILITWRITTGFPVRIKRPEGLTADSAGLSNPSLFLEHLRCHIHRHFYHLLPY